MLLYSINQNPLASTNDHNKEKSDEIGARLQREVEEERLAALRTSNYLPTYHVLPTSVLCESLFSVGKSIMTPQRRHMDPSTFEMIMILKQNRRFFDAMTLNRIIASSATENQAAKRRRTEDIIPTIIVTEPDAQSAQEDSDSDVVNEI